MVYPPRGGCAREAGAEGKILLRWHGRFCGCGGWRGGLAVTECWAVTECELCTVHKLGGGSGCGGYRGLRRGYGGVEGGFFWVCGGFCPILREGRFFAISGKVFKISAGRFWAVLGNVFKISGLHFFDI